MKKLLGLFLAIIIVQNVYSQNITLDCDCLDYDGWDTYPAKLTFSPVSGGGWKLGLKITYERGFFSFLVPDDIEEGEIQFPVEGTEINISEKRITLSNEKQQSLNLWLKTSSYISGRIELRESYNYWIEIRPSHKDANIIDEFHKLAAKISKPYTIKSATCDNSIIGLINNPLGIEWGDSWRTPYDEFILAAEYFYGNIHPTFHRFSSQEYDKYLKRYVRKFSIDICGEVVNTIDLEYGYLHRKPFDGKYIKSTRYNIFLHTPKAFKKDPSGLKEEECIWNKELVLEYYNEIRHELDLLGCNMQKVKSNYLYDYRGMKDGKAITLRLLKITDKYADFFSVSLTIAHQTKDFSTIIWE